VSDVIRLPPIKWGLCAATLLVTVGASAARLETSVDPHDIRVGDRLTYTVTMTPSPGEQALPFQPPASMDPFELVRSTSVGNTHALTLTTFEIDVATIPALSFRYRDAAGAERTISTPEIPVTIKSVLPKEGSGLKGLKGRPLPLPGRWIPWVVGALIGAVLLGIILVLRARRRRQKAAVAPPPLPPDEEALRALDTLDALIDGPAKPYYSRLTDTLKRYIERRFALPALDRTTTELFPLLKDLPVSVDLRRALRDLLESADLAKFAKVESPSDERRRHRDATRELVIQTRLVESTPHGGPAA
jgi:hypothetical protein